MFIKKKTFSWEKMTTCARIETWVNGQHMANILTDITYRDNQPWRTVVTKNRLCKPTYYLFCFAMNGNLC